MKPIDLPDYDTTMCVDDCDYEFVRSQPRSRSSYCNGSLP